MKNDIKWLSKAELSQYTGFALRSIDNYVRSGVLVAYKMGGRVLFDRDEVDECIRKRRIGLV